LQGNIAVMWDVDHSNYEFSQRGLLVVNELEVKMQMAQQNWKTRCRLS